MPTLDVVMSMDHKVVGNNREMRIAARRARIANRLLLASQSAQNAALQGVRHTMGKRVLMKGQQVLSLLAAFRIYFPSREPCLMRLILCVHQLMIVKVSIGMPNCNACSNKVEIEALLKKMRSLEWTFKERLYERLDEYNTALDAVRVQDSEEYNFLKVKLETDIQNLEQHLESMQAVYQLNGEKLDYNHRVLIERDNDNYVTAGQQKRKLTKQRDILCNLKARHAELEKSFKTQNAKLAEDYERFTRLLQDLQSKEQHLQAGHEFQQQKFFRMHQHSLAVLVSKALQADKIIHEQQLGWRWRPPSNKVFLDLASAKPDESMNSLDSHMQTEQLSSSSGEKLSEIVRSVQQPLLNALAYETSFIISDEMKNTVEGLDPNLANHLRSLAALQMLGVTSPDAFIKLHEYLDFDLKDRRGKDHIVSQLQSFLMQSKDNAASSLAFPDEQLQVALPTSLIKPSKVNPLGFSKEQEYWIDFTKAIDPKVFHVWGTLDISLQKYNQILKERWVLFELSNSLKDRLVLYNSWDM